jgi:hypothetical protein
VAKICKFLKLLKNWIRFYMHSKAVNATAQSKCNIVSSINTLDAIFTMEWFCTAEFMSIWLAKGGWTNISKSFYTCIASIVMKHVYVIYDMQ